MTKATALKILNPIICGDFATRLCPSSRIGIPKRVLALSSDNSNQTLFRQVIKRINAIGSSQINLGESLIVTNEERHFLAQDQLRELKNVHAMLLLEPVGRNTGPALSLAALPK